MLERCDPPTPAHDTTAMLINFDLLDDEAKRKAIKAIEEVANEHGGTVAETMNYDSNWGATVIYQP